MYDRIVIAVDGSDEAKHAARRGIGLAQTFGATVNVLFVVERKALRLTETADQKARLRERGETALVTVEDIARELGQSITTELVEVGPPSRSVSTRLRRTQT